MVAVLGFKNAVSPIQIPQLLVIVGTDFLKRRPAVRRRRLNHAKQIGHFHLQYCRQRNQSVYAHRLVTVLQSRQIGGIDARLQRDRLLSPTWAKANRAQGASDMHVSIVKLACLPRKALHAK